MNTIKKTAVILLAGVLAGTTLSRIIKSDVQLLSSSPLYSGNDGIISGSGTYWNPGTGQNILMRMV